MAELVYDEKMVTELDKNSVDKNSLNKGTQEDSVDDAQMVKEVEAFEERLQHDEATDQEYLVQEAWEVAIKVGLPLSTI